MTSTRTLGGFRGSDWTGARQSLTPPSWAILVPLPRLPRSSPRRHMPLIAKVEPDAMVGEKVEPNQTTVEWCGGGEGVKPHATREDFELDVWKVEDSLTRCKGEWLNQMRGDEERMPRNR